MGTLQGDTLNWDQNTRYTMGYYGNRGDGTSNWYVVTRTFNGGNVSIGATTDAAAVTGDGSVIALLKAIRGFFKREDDPAASLDYGIPAMAIRRDAPTADGAAGDYVPLHVDALGRLRVVGSHPEDGVHTSGDYGMFALGVSNTAKAAFGANGDYTPNAFGLAGESYMTPVPNGDSAWAASVYAAHAAASGVIKASAGKLYAVKVTNDNAAAQLVMFFNLTAVPVDGTAPLFAVYVPAKSTLPLDFLDLGRYFTTGICWSNSSTFATKTIGAADCSVAATYL